MMDAAALLSTLRARDVRLWIEDAQLKCSAPVGALDAGLREALASRKQEIMAFLRQAEALKSGPASIVPIKPEGRRPPIFAVSGHGGDVFCLLPLARHLHAEQPVIGVQPPGLDGTEPLKSRRGASTLRDRADTPLPTPRPVPDRRALRGRNARFRSGATTRRSRPGGRSAGAHRESVSHDVRASVADELRLSSYAKALTPGAFARRLQLRLERQKGRSGRRPRRTDREATGRKRYRCRSPQLHAATLPGPDRPVRHGRRVASIPPMESIRRNATRAPS